MRSSLNRAVLTCVLLLTAMPASATTFFKVEGLPGAGPRYSFNFSIADTAIAGPVTTTSARFNGTPFTYTRPNGTTEFVEDGRFDGPTFFTTRDQGGLAMLRLDRELAGLQQFRLFGAQLFTGPTSAPVFTLGTFDLASTPRNSPRDPIQPLTYRVTISDSPIGAVPEPATWAMMLLGFGFVGGAMRVAKRRQNIAVSYA